MIYITCLRLAQARFYETTRFKFTLVKKLNFIIKYNVVFGAIRSL